MSITKPKPVEHPASLPPLRHGERLDQPTFHARYEAMPEDFKAELIGGVVYVMPSPVSADHSWPHVLATWWLAQFAIQVPFVRGGTDGTLILGDASEPQPDAALWLLPERGGRVRKQGRYQAGPAELVVEVAVSSADDDLVSKKRDYERAGIPEYLVVLPEENRVWWFALVDGRYEPLAADDDGVLRSRALPGLWLDPQALLQDDRARLNDVAQQGLASSEHREWRARVEQTP